MTNLSKSFQNVKVVDKLTRIKIGKCILSKLNQEITDREIREAVSLAFYYEVPQLKNILFRRDELIEEQMLRAKYHISNTSGRWLVNGRSYELLNESEKKFFNDFMRETRINQNK